MLVNPDISFFGPILGAQHPDFVALQPSRWLERNLYCKGCNNGTQSLHLQTASLLPQDSYTPVSLNKCQVFA